MIKFNHDFSSRFRILKGGKISLVVSALLAGLSSTSVIAAPIGGVVTSGSATISQSGTTTNITQSTSKATINWQNFSIASNETVNFNQPNVNSITLNRVIGNERSIIDGALNANGQVWILNSNGILFNSTAKVNTAGILATTKNITDADFQAGNYKFTGESTQSIINLGTIESSDSGYVALLANTVQNDGTIKAYKGTVHLTGANEATINLNGNSIVSLTIDKGVLDALVENKNIIQADGGKIYLTTNAVDELLKGVVNNTGIIEAKSLEDVSSEVILFAHGGMANISGEIIADGGFVETSGKEFTIKEGATIKAKEWLIDPVNITIDSTLANTIVTALGNGDVTITTNGSNTPDTSSGESGTNGDITVASAITWASDNDLTLSAYRNIAINANITATGAGGKLSLYYGQGGGTTDNYTIASGKSINLQDGQNFSTKKGSAGTLNDYIVISSLGTASSSNDNTLQGMQGALAGKFALGTNIDASDTINWNSGAGFTPIGISTAGFTGAFDGLGHTVNALYINRPAVTTTNYVGLFGYYNNSATPVRNLGVTNANITGYQSVGAIAGYISANGGAIYNTWGSGTVEGKYLNIGGLYGWINVNLADSYSNVNVTTSGALAMQSIGGLVGSITGTITNSYSTGSVTANNSNTVLNFGGLAGSTNGNITNSYATGSVIMGSSTGASQHIGGLIGTSNGGTISSSYATGSVTALSTTQNIGGLIGRLLSGTVSSSYATGNVSHGSYVGGLVGLSQTTIMNSYATGNVSGDGATGYVGGLVGKSTSNIINSYETGSVTATGTGGYTGGLVGYSTSSISSNSYATGNVSATGQWTGGLVGYSTGAISNSFATGSVSGAQDTGGLVGSTSGTINSCYATGNVTGGQDTGGLVGLAAGDVTGSYASGDVSSSSYYVGGLVGFLNASVDRVYVLGNVTGTGANAAYIGGLAGVVNLSSADKGITNSYVVGTVTNGAGFIGNPNHGNGSHTYKTTLGNNYWSSTLSGQANAYGVNYAPGDIASDNTTNFGAISPYLQSTFSNLDFTNYWYSIDGKTLPFLRSEYATSNISSTHQLQLIGMNTTALGRTTYVLKNNIDFGSNTSSSAWRMWNPDNYFVPIGDSSTPFTGTFDGNSKTISNLKIIGANGSSYIGLFGSIGATGIVKKTGIVNANISGSNIHHVGAFTGDLSGLIENSYSTGTAVSSTGTGSSYVIGGIAGATQTGATIRYTYTSGGSVLGNANVGGFVGYSFGGTISNSYSVNSVSGGAGGAMGGFVGADSGSTTITNTYSAGAVSGSESWIGGWGGSVASNTLITNSFWDKEASGQAHSESESAGKITGKTTAEMKTSSTFSSAGWDTSSIWGRKSTDNDGYMVLKSSYSASTLWSTPVTITLTGSLTKTYGDANPSLSTIYTSDNGSVTLGWGSAMAQYTNAGTYAFSSTANIFAPVYGSGTADDYTISYTYGSYGITVSPYTLALSDFAASNKVYNANTTATVTGTLGAGLNGDTVNLTGIFGDKNVGTGKTVTAGVSNSNYTIAATTTTANITAKALTAITGITASNKEYNGNTSATIDFASAGFTGKETGDTLSISSATGTFDDKNVGTTKTVNISSITLGGTDAGNYSITGLAPTTTADITAKAITLTAPGVSKIYDGGLTYTATTGELTTLASSLVGSDTLTSINLAFTDKNAGTDNKTLNASSAVINDGNSGNNYSVSYISNTTSTIEKIALTLSGATASNKVYDGLTTATMTSWGTLTGVLSGETVTIDNSVATSEFANKNVGTGKTVNISGVTLGGIDAANYSAGSSMTATANITKADITAITGITANNKTYDGTAVATLTTTGASFTGKIGSDVLTVATSTGAFDNKNVGTGKTVNITALTLGGADAGNYNLTSAVATTTANITAKAITLTAPDVSKTYDGGLTYTATSGELTTLAFSLVGSDTLTSINLAFTDKNAGTDNKTLNASSAVINDGNSGNNYSVSYTSNTTSTITPKTVGLSVSKPYDGTTDLTNAVTINTGIVGENLTYTSATSNSANASTANNYISSITLADGTGIASNYTLPVLDSTNAAVIINEKPVVVTLSGSSTPSGIFGTPIVLPTPTSNDVNAPIVVKVFNSSNEDVTTEALAGTLGAGTYTVKPIGTSSNYAINDVSSTLTIGAKDVTAIASKSQVSSIFGQAIELPTFSFSDTTATSEIKVFDKNGNDVTADANAKKLQPGQYKIKAIPNSSNYAFLNNEIPLVINQAFDPETVAKIPKIELPKLVEQTKQPVANIQVTANTNDSGSRDVVIEKPSIVTFMVPAATATEQSNSGNKAVTNLAVKLGVNEGESVSLVSAPIEGQATERIMLSELKQTNTNKPTAEEKNSARTNEVQDVRVAISQNSIVELVNGGVNLPSGLDQEFYVVKTDSKKQRGIN